MAGGAPGQGCGCGWTPIRSPRTRADPGVGITETPTLQGRWYSRIMSTTFELHVGDRGRVVLPAALREELGLRQGDVLSVTLEGGQLVASTPRAALKRVRARIRGTGVVEELLEDRRRQVEAEQ